VVNQQRYFKIPRTMGSPTRSRKKVPKAAPENVMDEKSSDF